MTKKDREAAALARRQQQVEDQRKAMADLKKKQRQIFDEGKKLNGKYRSNIWELTYNFALTRCKGPAVTKEHDTSFKACPTDFSYLSTYGYCYNTIA